MNQSIIATDLARGTRVLYNGSIKTIDELRASGECLNVFFEDSDFGATLMMDNTIPFTDGLPDLDLAG